MQWLSRDRVVNGNIIARLYSYQVRQWHYYYFFFRRSAGCYKTPEVGSVRIGWLWWVGGANCWYARLGKRVSHCNLPTDRPTDLTRAWRVGLYGKYDCRGGGDGVQSGGAWGFQLGRALTLALAMLRPHGFVSCRTRLAGATLAEKFRNYLGSTTQILSSSMWQYWQYCSMKQSSIKIYHPFSLSARKLTQATPALQSPLTLGHCHLSHSPISCANCKWGMCFGGQATWGGGEPSATFQR